MASERADDENPDDPKVIFPLPPPKEIPDRITLSINLVHEHHGDKPHQFSLKAFEWLKNPHKEEVYSRRFTATEEWKLIDLGWYVENPDRVGFIVVDNMEGRNFQVNPTDEERAAIKKKIVMLGSDVGMRLRIKPGWGQQVFPENPRLLVRCESGNAQCRITVYPG